MKLGMVGTIALVGLGMSIASKTSTIDLGSVAQFSFFTVSKVFNAVGEVAGSVGKPPGNVETAPENIMLPQAQPSPSPSPPPAQQNTEWGR
jgi:hypothetical protein